jgi:ABC-type multidrug transport system permease subunit
MRLLSVFRKSAREQWRDPLTLSLVLIFAPLVVLLYRLFFPTGSTTYTVLILNQDIGVQQAAGQIWNAGDELLTELKQVTYADGSPLLVVEQVADRAAGEARIKNRAAQLLLIIAPEFSQALQSGTATDTATVTYVGDLTQPYYAVAAVLTNGVLETYVKAALGQPMPIHVTEEPLGASGARTEFENYVPGLLIFAVILLVFSAPMAVAREVEAGTLRRLQITRMRSLDFLGGVTLTQVIVGVAALLLALAVALLLGFRSQGPLWAAILIGVIASLSVIGVGLIVACFSRTVTQAFLLANFPLAFFMFFSGAMFPVPRLTLFWIGGQSMALFDILPTSHAVIALQKIFVLGAGLSDVAYELSALTVLSVLYFAIGVWLFKRTQLRAAH